MNLPNHVIGFPFPLAHLVHEWVESCGYSHLGQPLTYPPCSHFALLLGFCSPAVEGLVFILAYRVSAVFPVFF